MGKIKIIIADDHPTVVEGLVNYFKGCNDIEVVATTGRITEIEPLVNKFVPAILLMDYHFSNESLTGLDICRLITAEYPCTKIIVISSFSEVALVKEFISAGASGYLLKTATRNVYIEAIKNVFAGGEVFGKDIAELLVKDRLQHQHNQQIRFTKTEREILKLIVQGDSTGEIAKKLFREKSTIDSHRKSILSKLQLMDSENPKHSKNIIYYVNKLNLANRIDCL